MQNIKVLYEDNHIIVVVKPNNVPSQGDKTGDVDMLTMVKQYIKEKYHKPGDVYVSASIGPTNSAQLWRLRGRPKRRDA